MKAEEYKKIEELLERFFEGQTSNEEERALYDFFSGTDLPPHLESYREVFGYFESGIAGEFREAPELKPPVKTSPVNRRVIAWTIALCVAASLTLLLVIRFPLFMGGKSDFNPYEGSYIVRNGERITDWNEIQGEIEATRQEAEARKKEADRLLRDIGEIKRLSNLAYDQVAERNRELLSGIPDRNTRKMISAMLGKED